MIVGEYGVMLAFSTGYNMASYSELTLILTKPDGTTLTRTTGTGVALGVTPLTTTIGVMAPNQYITYFFQNGDVDQSGLWEAEVIYDQTGPVKHLKTRCTPFTVSPVCG